MPNSAVRRRVLIGAALAIPAVLVAGRAMLRPQFDGQALTVQDAHALAVRGDITLVDIRRPDEWAATGSGEGAVRIDMRDEDFIEQLLAVVEDRNAPIALICARGVRSARLSNRLTEAGFSTIIDVPEGMLGSSAGPGWLASGLPVVQS